MIAIDRLDHLVVTVKDIEASVRFYVDVLGLELDSSNGRFAVRFGNQKINLHRGKAEFLPAARRPTAGSADFCLVARGNIADIYAELLAKNAPLEPGMGIVPRTGATGPIDSIYLRDPDGNLVEVSVYRA